MDAGARVGVVAVVVLLLVPVRPVAAATPNAVDDAYTTSEDQQLSVDAPGVLANDTVDGATLALETGPGHGTLDLQADGSFTYLPDTGFTGTDTFTYSLTQDGGVETVALGDVDPDADDALLSAQPHFARAGAAGDRIVFPADDGTSGSEPWVADGTAGSAQLLADIDPDGDGLPTIGGPELTAFDGLVWFVADDGTGERIWRTDGTTAGTEVAFELSGPSSSHGGLTVSGGTLFFVAAGSIWALGDAAGTPAKVAERGSIMAPYAGGVLLYTETDSTFGFEPHFSTGGPAELVADIMDGSGSSAVGLTSTHGSDVFFTARSDPNTFSAYLWYWDGQQLYDGTNHIQLVSENDPSNLTAGPGGAYVFRSGTLGYYTPSGTFVTLIDGQSGVSAFGPIDVIGSRVVFTAEDADHGRELWATDGTTSGTALVADVNAGTGDGYATYFGNSFGLVDGRVHVGLDDGVHGTEVWASDGTAVGTVRLTDVNTAGGATPVGYSAYGDGVFFFADDGTTGLEPYVHATVPGASDEATVTITVEEATDSPPTIEPIADITTPELEQVVVEPVVSDPEGDSYTLSWDGVPEGAILNGFFDWTPAEDQGPGEYTVTVTATQDSDPTLSDSESFTITVEEVNAPPVLDPVGEHTATVDEELTFTATASDPDIPSNTLTFSLAGTIPDGATITADGAFSWVPTSAQVGDHTFDVVVSDGTLTDSETITVTVTDGPPPVVVAITEGVGVADGVVVRPPVVVTVSEGIGVDDAVAVRPPVVLQVHEAVGVSDENTLTGVVEGQLFDQDGTTTTTFFTGDPVRFTGDGFAPDSTVEIELRSDPIPLGTTTADGTGAIDVTVTLPADAPPGEHTLVGVGVAPEGFIHEVRATLTLLDGSPTIDVGTLEPVQHSDGLAPVLVTITDPNSAPSDLTVTATGLPNDVSVAPLTCSETAVGTTCTTELTGTVTAPAGTYEGLLTVTDGAHEATADVTVVVLPEDGRVALLPSNPTSVTVDPDTGTSGLVTLHVRVTEDEPDEGHDPGRVDLDGVGVTVTLQPLDHGSTVSATCTRTTTEDVLTLTCTVDELPVGTYAVTAELAGEFMAGSDEDVLTVSDPDLGFATGGGEILWPGTATPDCPGDRTGFGFTMEHNRKGTNVKGSFLLVRHTCDGGIFRVRSNALDGLAIGTTDDVAWASFSGKATFFAPWMDEEEGNHSFTVYVEDGDTDRLWVEVRDKDGDVIADASLPRPGDEHAVAFHEGDVVVPVERRQSRKKRGRRST